MKINKNDILKVIREHQDSIPGNWGSFFEAVTYHKYDKLATALLKLINTHEKSYSVKVK